MKDSVDDQDSSLVGRIEWPTQNRFQRGVIPQEQRQQNHRKSTRDEKNSSHLVQRLVDGSLSPLCGRRRNIQNSPRVMDPVDDVR